MQVHVCFRYEAEGTPVATSYIAAESLGQAEPLAVPALTLGEPRSVYNYDSNAARQRSWLKTIAGCEASGKV